MAGGCPWSWSPYAIVDFEFNVAAPRTPVDTADPPVFAAAPVFTAIPGRSGHHAPTITALPDGTLLAAWYSYIGPGERDGAAIYLSRRAPDAPAWDAPVLHIDRPETDGNPVLYSEGDRVWLFQAVVPGGWSTAHIEVQQSHDGGLTWSAPAAIAGPVGANVRFPPVRTASGALLLPAYDDLFQRSLFFVSEDGTNWRELSAVVTAPPRQNLQPSIVRLRSGRLLAVLRNSGGGWLWVTASDDDGRTWAQPRDAGFPNPDSPAVLLGLASGHLLLAYNDSSAARRPLVAALSADEGVTWHRARVLADGPGAYAYPAAVQGPDGGIHVVYSDDRAGITHVEFNEAWLVQREP